MCFCWARDLGYLFVHCLLYYLILPSPLAASQFARRPPKTHSRLLSPFGAFLFLFFSSALHCKLPKLERGPSAAPPPLRVHPSPHFWWHLSSRHPYWRAWGARNFERCDGHLALSSPAGGSMTRSCRVPPAADCAAIIHCASCFGRRGWHNPRRHSAGATYVTCSRQQSCGKRRRRIA